MKKFNYLFLALVIVLSSCGKDDDNNKNLILNSKGKATVTIGGKSLSFTKANHRLADIISFSNSKDEILSISLPDQSKVKLPIKYDKNTTELIVLVYTKKTNGVEKKYTNLTLTGETLKPNFKIEITKYENKKTSGSFEFTVYNNDDKKDSLLIKGTFTDVPYL